MSKRRKNKQAHKYEEQKNVLELAREEKEISTEIAFYLQTLFGGRYEDRKERSGNNKSKDKNSKDGKKKYISRRLSPADIRKIKERIRERLLENKVGTPHKSLKSSFELSAEQKSMINMDYDGIYFVPARETLSKIYRHVRETSEAAKFEVKDFDLDSIPVLNEIKKYGSLKIHEYKSKDFNLDDIPIWNEMKKYKSFQTMIAPLKDQLAGGGFSPENLPYLKYEDVIDLIARHSRDHHDQKMIGQKQRFLKMFAVCYGYQFLRNETLLGHGKEAKDFLIYVIHIDKPKECPPEVKYASDVYSIHHGKNRQFAGELEDPSEVNSFKYLSLTRNFPHHKVLHTPETIDLDPKVVFFGSFKKDFQIMRDPERERQYAKGEIRFGDFVKELKILLDQEDGKYRHHDPKNKKRDKRAQFYREQRRCKNY